MRHAPGCGKPVIERGPGTFPTPDRIRRFVAQRMERAPGQHVSIAALMTAWDDWEGNEGHYAAPNTFGRWIRQSVPDGVTVQRRRLDNDRQNWVIGMRLREQ